MDDKNKDNAGMKEVVKEEAAIWVVRRTRNFENPSLQTHFSFLSIGM